MEEFLVTQEQIMGAFLGSRTGQAQNSLGTFTGQPAIDTASEIRTTSLATANDSADRARGNG